MNYRIKIITGKDHNRRGVAFLISDDRKINAHRFYSDLAQDNIIRRQINVRFDNWRDGQPEKKHRYHGWNKSDFKGQYTHCFVFKYDNNRLYGFLCNPKQKNPRYQICILVRHAIKNERETDETDLKQVVEMSSNITIRRMINDFFKEKP